MGLVTLRNINPIGQVDLPLIARQGEPLGQHGIGCLEPGEEFDVPATVAGRAPSGDPAGDDYDPGEGLLAQVGNYEHVAGELIEPDGVPAGAISKVLDWVGDDPIKAASAIEAENLRPKPRTSLLEQLAATIEKGSN